MGFRVSMGDQAHQKEVIALFCLPAPVGRHILTEHSSCALCFWRRFDTPLRVFFEWGILIDHHPCRVVGAVLGSTRSSCFMGMVIVALRSRDGQRPISDLGHPPRALIARKALNTRDMFRFSAARGLRAGRPVSSQIVFAGVFSPSPLLHL